MAVAAGLSELVGGTLLALGLLTPLAALLIISTMVTAIWTVHAANGPWASDNGYEYNLVLAAVVFAVAAVGPGAWSLDAVLGLDLAGAGWALAALAAGLVGSVGAVFGGRRGARQGGGRQASPSAA
jgi:putative oxidoreductase